MDTSPVGYASDGGFPFQVGAISDLFDATTLIVPCFSQNNRAGEIPLIGRNLSVIPLSTPVGSGLRRKIDMIFWVVRNLPILIREIRRADAVHTPIPSDIGTIGMLLAFLLRKPLFVRHCGNWFVQKSVAERFWKWFMECTAGGKNVMVATGGAAESPSQRNAAIRWIFSTSLTQREMSECVTRRNPTPAPAVRLIIACRQEKGKGTEKVIESLALLLNDFPQTILDVVGDGEKLSDYKRVARALNVSNRVTFHGKVNHSTMIRLLSEADLFCYPTDSEGFPKVVLEALACGLPVITTRVSVLPELIGNGCGVLLEEASVEALAKAVRYCLLDQESYQAMSRQAVETARHYSLERWGETIDGWLRAEWGPLRSNA